MSAVKKAIFAEVKELLPESIKLKKQMDEAKTTTKSKYFEKKLRKVNNQIRDLFAAAERLEKKNG